MNCLRFKPPPEKERTRTRPSAFSDMPRFYRMAPVMATVYRMNGLAQTFLKTIRDRFEYFHARPFLVLRLD